MRFLPPLTSLQAEQWQQILQEYYSDHVLDEAVRNMLIKLLWENVNKPRFSTRELRNKDIPIRMDIETYFLHEISLFVKFFFLYIAPFWSKSV